MKALPIKNISPRNNVALEKRLFITIVIAVVITGALAVTSLTRNTTFSAATSFLCSAVQSNPSTTPIQIAALLHYATSRDVPQQSKDEIAISFRVLQSLSPCNFLVFGLGHDSLMWASFNPRGTTLFLEEDIKWVHRILSRAPLLRVHAVNYDTRLSEAEDLLSSYKHVKECLPPRATLQGNSRCRLALSDLPDQVYSKEWDVIMIDAPRGYFAAAPGRMTVIYSAAVMARKRKRAGVTHVFLHDVNRKVEKAYAEEFLCKKYLVKGVGRLWHFEIPPAKDDGKGSNKFC